MIAGTQQPAGADHEHPHLPEHAHPHEYPAVDPEQAQLGPSRAGSVVLDIGGDIGALILAAPESMALVEIEISPAGRDAERTHVAIRERLGPGGKSWAAIYPALRAGEYTLWSTTGEPADRITIVGGQVAQLDWR